MTWEIALVLGILAVALVLFITEVLRMDVVAMLVLVVLAATGLVDADDALSGFSNPAVITVWAMFILSEGLTRTGIADIMGTQVLRVAGQRCIGGLCLGLEGLLKLLACGPEIGLKQTLWHVLLNGLHPQSHALL